MTVCKHRMYTKDPHFLIEFFDRNASKNSITVEEVRSWVYKHTWNRSKVFRMLSHKTHEGFEEYPCNTISGQTVGKPCSFPFVFPDCSMKDHKHNFCSISNQSKIYHQCISYDALEPWCSTRNYLNDSHIFENWGHCSEKCKNISRTTGNLQFYDDLWEEKIDYLLGGEYKGHCFTYNPLHKSAAGHAGQLYALLGKSSSVLASVMLTRNRIDFIITQIDPNKMANHV